MLTAFYYAEKFLGLLLSAALTLALSAFTVAVAFTIYLAFIMSTAFMNFPGS